MQHRETESRSERGRVKENKRDHKAIERKVLGSTLLKARQQMAQNTRRTPTFCVKGALGKMGYGIKDVLMLT